ncbi:MAG: FecR family protein [Nevskia sp.]|nr:FecR family protein [Nevskia sp.]
MSRDRLRPPVRPDSGWTILLRACICCALLVCTAARADVPEQAGTVALAEGTVTAATADGTSRKLGDGDAIYAGDTITTGSASYADLDFEDGATFVLRPDSQFRVQSYHYEADAHDPDQPATPAAPESAFFQLVKGGFRAVTGLIGHLNRDEYRIDTPTATIGIRGTGYDVRYCQDDCADEGGAAPENGLYTSVNKGSIAMRNESGETVAAVGQNAHIASIRDRVRLLRQRPRALSRMTLPPALAKRAMARRQQIRQHRLEIRQHRRAAGLLRRPAQTGPGPGAPRRILDGRRRCNGAAAGCKPLADRPLGKLRRDEEKKRPAP